MRRRGRRGQFLARMFLLDVIVDERARPILVFAAFNVTLGATLYHWLEGWSWLDSLYFVVITLTTIGYGDIHPTQPITKLITIFYAVNGIVLLLMLFDVIRMVRWKSVGENGGGMEQTVAGDGRRSEGNQ